jgi:hypothetical protein
MQQVAGEAGAAAAGAERRRDDDGDDERGAPGVRSARVRSAECGVCCCRVLSRARGEVPHPISVGSRLDVYR